MIDWIRRGACRRLFPFIAVSLSFVHAGAAPAAEPKPEIALFAPPESAGQIEQLFRQNGMTVRTLSEVDLLAVDAAAPDALVIGPGARVPAEGRPAIDRFRRAGGRLAVADPAAFQYPNTLQNPTPVIELSQTDVAKIHKGSRNGAEPHVEIRPTRTSSGSRNAVEIATRLVGDGDVFLEIPLRNARSPERSILGFEAKGGPGVSVLYLDIQDTGGRRWIAFADVDATWSKQEIALENFLPQTSDKEEPEFLNPAEIATLRVGMSARVLWTEQPGSFSIGNVVLGEGTRAKPVRTAEVSRWRVQIEAVKAPFPEWAWDPFLGARPIPGKSLVEVPKPPHERGRRHAPASTQLAIDDVQYRALATTAGADGTRVTTAELRRYNDGPFAKSQLLLIGAAAGTFSPGTASGELLLSGVQKMFEPAIIRVTPFVPGWKGDRTPAFVRVELTNPTGRTINGSVRVEIAGGAITGTAAAAAGANENVTVDVKLSDVPANFDWRKFVCRVDLQIGNRTADTLTDEIDVGEMLLAAARYLVRVQDHHGDGRYSHHFFSDQYSARFLFGFARLLKRTSGGADIGLAVDDGEIAGFAESAFRFGDMIARRQDPDGSFPMGYFEHRDFRYVADLGQVCMGMIQMASWLPDGSERRERYIETVRKYLKFRQSFRITPARAERLEREYGPHPSIRAGYYGLGLLDIDYFGDAKWGELRREERGPWWVLPVSLGFLGGLAELENDPDARKIAREDVGVYFDTDAEITRSSHFHTESLFWILYGIEDRALRKRIAKKLNDELPPRIFRGLEYPGFYLQGRGSIWPISAVYAHRYLEEKPAWRAVFLAELLGAGMDSSSKSLRNVIDHYPLTSYGPSLGAYRYASFNAFWILELIDEGSSLLRDKPLPRALD